jgi:hypothetical protein
MPVPQITARYTLQGECIREVIRLGHDVSTTMRSTLRILAVPAAGSLKELPRCFAYSASDDLGIAGLLGNLEAMPLHRQTDVGVSTHRSDFAVPIERRRRT